MATMSKGKLQGMTEVADDAGIIRAAAMDQRGSLKKSLAKERDVAPEKITDEMMAEFKTAVIKVLSPY
ncbi:MAG: tagatose 1,6-diphosphate aldolase, partial [Acidobacteriota bacterium]